MKRIMTLAILTFSSLSVWAGAKTFNVDDPPFYTMTFEEISRFNNPNEHDPDVLKARSEYFANVFKRVSRLKSSASHQMTAVTSVQQLERLSYNDDSWNKFRADVFYACEERKENNGCRDLLAYRMNVFTGLSPLHKSR